MSVKLNASELSKLLPWLEKHLPATSQVQGLLECQLRGKFPDLDFCVDQWPHPQAVIVVVEPNSKEECLRFFDDSAVALFAVTSEALSSVLSAAYDTLTDWSRPKLFHAVPNGLLPMIRPMMEKEFEFALKAAFVLKATSWDLTPQPVPCGMKVSPITDATVGIVDSTWTMHDANSINYVRYLARHFSSVVLTTARGEHVGHMVGTNYGTMGLLYVMPGYRGQGYAKVIVSQLARKYFNDGEDVYVVVNEQNLPSLNLHLSLGFKPLDDLKLSWMYVSLAK